MFKEMQIGPHTFKGAYYCFHEPAPLTTSRNPKLVRATTTAVLLEDGRLFCGISVASESDQFEKGEGHWRAASHVDHKVTRALRGAQVMPDAILDTSLDPKIINQKVKEACDDYELEHFRWMLSERAKIIDSQQKQLDALQVQTMILSRKWEEAANDKVRSRSRR